MPLTRLDHYNVSTAKPDETLRFYCDGLGLVNDPARRPDFGIPGAWLFVDDQPLVHLVFVEDDPGAPTGPLDHVAFDGTDRQEVVAFDQETGAIVWRTPRDLPATIRPSQRKAFTTPLVVRTGSRVELVSPGAQQVVAYDPRSGRPW